MAHPDLDKLLNALLPFAQQMLQKYGEFHPFGASMSNDGTIAMLGAQENGKEFPKAVDLIAILEAGLRESAAQDKIKASGICMDVRIMVPASSEKTDAIQASLEHAETGAVNVFLPYKKGFFKRISYGEIFASAADRRIFSKG